MRLRVHCLLVTACFVVIPVAGKSRTAREDAAFTKKLGKNDQISHALDRLTFGQRPGDMDRVRKIGLKKWIDAQLNPERISENPVLLARLENLETLRMSPREIWQKYPQTSSILAVLRGKPPIPSDPLFRMTTERYASYFRLDDTEKPTGAALKPIAALQDFISPDQIAILRSGKPDQKLAVLAAVPEEQWDPFFAAMDRTLRGQLQNIAPIAMKRRMMMFNSAQQVVAYDLQTAKMDRAILSHRQLAEQLADFWYNHFNVYLDKGNDRFLVPAYDREVIRPHILGKFEDLLSATAHSPAMLYYLDNYQSVAPPAESKRRGQRGLNENYARELLELHTLGVDGGYTQNDIIGVARCFTGWTIRDAKDGSVFWFNEKAHDRGEKVVLGVTIPAGGGEDDGRKVIEILAHHPSTARFISTELAQRFVADKPPESLVRSMADTYLSSGGDIRAVMKTMLSSKEFWSKGAYRAKLKTPLEMVASAARATNAEVHDSFALANQVAALGEPLFRKTEPTGYLNTSDEWISSGALLTRMNFAMRFAENRVLGVRVKPDDLVDDISAPDVNATAERLLFTRPTSQTREAIETAIQKQKESSTAKRARAITPAFIAALILGSPDFQRR